MITTPARVALDTHTALYQTMKHPPASLIRFYDHFMATGREVVAQQRQRRYAGLSPADADVLAAWEHYVWPAATGRDLIALMAGPLFSAPTYQVTAEIVHAVTGMYQATAENGSALRSAGRAGRHLVHFRGPAQFAAVQDGPALRAAEMPSRTGFAYLDEPVTLTDATGETVSARALSWGPQLFDPPDAASPQNGVRVTSWCWPASQPGAALRGDDGEWSGTYSVFIPFGAAPDYRGDDITRWLHCLWLFMGTEIVTTARPDADRASRRRAAKAGRKHSDVTVILLRRSRRDGEGAHRDVDWSCCWVVQAHARHLEDYRALGYEHHQARTDREGGPCLVCACRTTHVRAYVKGPEGKPLKSTGQVFRVSR